MHSIPLVKSSAQTLITRTTSHVVSYIISQSTTSETGLKQRTVNQTVQISPRKHQSIPNRIGTMHIEQHHKLRSASKYKGLKQTWKLFRDKKNNFLIYPALFFSPFVLHLFWFKAPFQSQHFLIFALTFSV